MSAERPPGGVQSPESHPASGSAGSATGEGEEEEEEEGSGRSSSERRESGLEESAGSGAVPLEGDWVVVAESSGRSAKDDGYLGFRATGRPASSSRSVPSPPAGSTPPRSSSAELSSHPSGQAESSPSGAGTKDSPPAAPAARAAALAAAAAAALCRAAHAAGAADGVLGAADTERQARQEPRRRQRAAESARIAAVVAASPLNQLVSRPQRTLNESRLRRLRPAPGSPRAHSPRSPPPAAEELPPDSPLFRERLLRGMESARRIPAVRRPPRGPRHPTRLELEHGPGADQAVVRWCAPEGSPQGSYRVLLCSGPLGSREPSGRWEQAGEATERCEYLLTALQPHVPYAVTVVADPPGGGGAEGKLCVLRFTGRLAPATLPPGGRLPSLAPSAPRRRAHRAAASTALPVKPHWRVPQYSGGMLVPRLVQGALGWQRPC